MLLKFNRDTELRVVGFGVYQPGKIIEVSDELGKTMLETGYFDEIEEEKEIKIIKRKKSKRKGVEKLCQSDREDI